MLSYLLLCSGVFGADPQALRLDNLSFASGRLTGWEGNGFGIGPAGGVGPSLHFGVDSGDRGAKGRKGLLYRTFVVPSGVTSLAVRVAAVRAPGRMPGPALDVLLEGADRKTLPRWRRTPSGLQPAARIKQGTGAQTDEVVWRLDGLAGHYLRIILIDEDDRPGCYLVCGGFRFVAGEAFAARDPDRDMRHQTLDRNPGGVTRADSTHFSAVGTAEESFVDRRLDLCESLYDTFFDHFRSRGFPARQPKGKLVLAVFDTREALEGALGEHLPDAVTGLYLRKTNRLLVYDVGTNRALQEGRDRAKAEVMRLNVNDPERGRGLAELDKRARAWRDETNASTVLHEAAHQLSFNSGLLNREGDVPLWLAEGLACYCEGPGAGGRGPGGPNPERTRTLAATARGKGNYLPLRTLVEDDDWYTRRPTEERILLGYAQSWALFRMLMEERSPALLQYLARVYERRRPGERLADFVAAFGELGSVDIRYQTYLRELAGKGERKP